MKGEKLAMKTRIIRFRYLEGELLYSQFHSVRFRFLIRFIWARGDLASEAKCVSAEPWRFLIMMTRFGRWHIQLLPLCSLAFQCCSSDLIGGIFEALCWRPVALIQGDGARSTSKREGGRLNSEQYVYVANKYMQPNCYKNNEVTDQNKSIPTKSTLQLVNNISVYIKLLKPLKGSA